MSRKEEMMKRICTFASIFVVTFLVSVSVIMLTDDAMAGRKCIWDLPCAIEDIYCTQTPCWGTCYPMFPSGVFYCAGDWGNPHCSGDYYYPVPCAN